MTKNIAIYSLLIFFCSCAYTHRVKNNKAITNKDSIPSDIPTATQRYGLENITIIDSLTKTPIYYIIWIDFLENKRDTILDIEALPRKVNDTFEYFTIVDSIRPSYTLPNNFVKPKKWKEMEKLREAGDFFGDWYGNPYPNTFTLSVALSIIDTETDFSQVGSAKSWCIDNYEQVFGHLVARLTNKQKIGLTGTADLIIDDRMETNDLQSYLHGGAIDEDIFTISGRASWILNQLTGENFAEVHGNLTKDEAIKFKLLWVKYIKKLKKNN
jgi:hypothetical protein